MNNHIEHYRQDALEFDYFSQPLTPNEQRRNQVIYDLCATKPGQSLLDIGSGRGWLALHMAALGVNVSVADLAQNNLDRIAQLNPNITTMLADAYTINPGQKYDWLTAIEMVEHLQNPQQALSHWRSLLQPDGHLLISVPYNEHIQHDLCIHCNKPTPRNAHLHSFNYPKLYKLLLDAGYTVTHTRRYQHKLLVHMHLNNYLTLLPYNIWKRLDRHLISFSDKATYIAMVAKVKS